MNCISGGCCECEVESKETTRVMLQKLGATLGELRVELSMIADAVYKGRTVNGEKEKGPDEMPPVVIALKTYCNTAEELLKETVKIREALW